MISRLKHVGANGGSNPDKSRSTRTHPQVSFIQSKINPESFFGKLRTLYSGTVLKTQLDQMKKQGSYDAFNLQYQERYNTRKLQGARMRPDGIPPSLFWESDVGKWIEATCYFLASPDGTECIHAAEFNAAIDKLVKEISNAQQDDGYLNIYFTVVDPTGRFKNLRDMHEMYNAGHLLEGAIAHYYYTGKRDFLDVMIRNVECFMKTFGLGENQLHGYPGHPELELAVLRLYEVTQNPEHLAFGHYLLEARGQPREDQDGDSYFIWEARQRNDELVPSTLNSLRDMTYNQSHAPLHEQNEILGHSVRALYLTTAAADLGGDFLADAKRLLLDAVDRKMYVTGGLGTEPRSTAEGGCYAETCASIACMMTCERILSHELNGKAREAMELCLLNAVIGGGSLDGKAFAYDQKLATGGNETAIRHEWFEVCCCPPNLSRTLGMLGGYTWRANVDAEAKRINLDVWKSQGDDEYRDALGGHRILKFEAPEGWSWVVAIPSPSYAENVKISKPAQSTQPGFVTLAISAVDTVEMTFDMPIRLIAPHIKTGQDTLSVKRGPISYVAESVDNEIESRYPHFEGLGVSSSTTFKQQPMDISGFEVIALQSSKTVYAVEQLGDDRLYRPVSEKEPARSWKHLDTELVFVPWFARANRGGAGHVRTAFLRVD